MQGGTATGCTANNNGEFATPAFFNGAGIKADGGMVTGCNTRSNKQNGIYAPGGFVTGCTAKGNSQDGGSWSGIYVTGSGGLATNNN